jgi:hypothetical protein
MLLTCVGKHPGQGRSVQGWLTTRNAQHRQPPIDQIDDFHHFLKPPAVFLVPRWLAAHQAAAVAALGGEEGIGVCSPSEKHIQLP